MKHSLRWLAALFLMATAVQAKPKSNVVRIYLAGARLEDAKPFIKYDARERYYLTRRRDGLGHLMVISLFLCPDKKQIKWVLEPPTEPEIERVPLPRLRNGSGINIGDTPAQVVKKIGRQPPKLTYERRNQTRVYIYEAPIVLRIEEQNKKMNWEYKGIYTFKNERLWAIEYQAREPDHGNY